MAFCNRYIFQYLYKSLQFQEC